MTNIMRERLCVSAAKHEFAKKGSQLPDSAWSDPEAKSSAIETYGDIVDTILAELREPDETMMLPGMTKLDETGDGGSEWGLRAAFTAMIDSVLEAE